MITKSSKEFDRKQKIIDFMKNQAILILLIGLIVLMSFIRTDTFLTVRNLLNILRQVTVLGIISSGMTIVLISGNLDLSVGSTLSLCMVVPILLQPRGLFIAISATILVGLTVGLTNGFLVGKLGGNAIIVTLGMMTIVQGIAFLVTGGMNVLGDPANPYSIIGRGMFYQIPIPVLIFLIIVLISHFAFTKTILGRSIYAVGGNEQAAHASGINTSRVKIICFVILGLYVALGGIISSSLIASAQPTAGQGFEFDVLTAVVLGGTSLFGGIGGIMSTVIGVLLIGVLDNSMIMLNIPFAVRLTIKGAILIAAVYYDVVSRGRKD